MTFLERDLLEQINQLREENAKLVETVTAWRDFCISKCLDTEARCYENVLFELKGREHQ